MAKRRNRRRRPTHPGIRQLRSGRWNVHSVAGIRVSMTFASRDEAIAWQARKLLEFRGGTTASAVLSLDEALDAYVESLPIPRTEQQKKAHRERATQLRFWRQQLGRLKISEVTPVLIRQARSRLEVSDATRNRYKSSLSRAMSWMVDERGWLYYNPARQVSQLLERKPVPRVYSPEEARRLLDACRRSPEWRLYPMIHLALLMMLRRGEVKALRWSQIDWARDLLTLGFDSQKGRRLTSTPIPPRARQILEELRKTRRRLDSDLIFAREDGKKPKSVRKWLLAAYREAGIENVSQPWHSLRHTGATYFLLENGNPGILMQLLRHGSMAMTMRYVTLAAENLRGELDRLEKVWG